MPKPATPLVPLRQLSPRPEIRILAKCEWYLPTGSVKDRIASRMIADAEAAGVLEPGSHLLEPSSGNTGIALAHLAREKGYSLSVVVPSNVSSERKELLSLLGAELIETPGEEGSNGAIRYAHELAQEPGLVMLDQYSNPANPEAHFRTTGQEVLTQVDHVDAFVACLGTGGTLMGVGRALREAFPNVSVVAAEPPTGEAISGLRSLEDGYVPPIFDPSAIDGKILVRTRDAIAMCRRILIEEGLFAGISSGAAVHAAVRWSKKLDAGTIVTLLPDGGWKYLSTGAWSGTVADAESRLGGQIYL